jgi:hypothetical protein
MPPYTLRRRPFPVFSADRLADPSIEPELLFAAIPVESSIAIDVRTPGQVMSDYYVLHHFNASGVGAIA